MTKEKCSGCYWFRQCGRKKMNICEDYDPLDENYEVERFIEAGRIEYRKEWEDYMNYLTYDNWEDEYDSTKKYRGM